MVPNYITILLVAWTLKNIKSHTHRRTWLSYYAFILCTECKGS